jgi:deoxyribodipyrimidine photolyase-related protein
VGDDACPFTTLYWDFLMRHAELLQGNPRMRYPLQNLGRLDEAEKVAIRARAEALRQDNAKPGGTP